MKRMLTFDDVALVPQYNNINSRADPFLGTNLTRNIKLATPIVASSMDSVIGDDLADLLIDCGSKPIFHRFTTEKQIKEWINKYGENCIISWGVKDLDKLRQLLLESKQAPAGICLDVAHGHSLKMRRAIEYIKEHFTGIDIIAGAVCTYDGVRDLAQWGADGVRAGIGGGSACSTRMVTGFGLPQFSVIQECSRAADQMDIPLICDGGIRDSRDCVLALAAGADSVMLGKLLAACKESAAEKAYKDGEIFHNMYGTMEPNMQQVAKYRGQASAAFQRSGRAVEGEEAWIPVTGSARTIIHDFELALKSAMTYGGARTIRELQTNAEFVEVTSNYMNESRTRL